MINLHRDNKYLFYTAGTNPNYSDTYIYWAGIDGLIDSLRHTNFIPYRKYTIPNQTDTVVTTVTEIPQETKENEQLQKANEELQSKIVFAEPFSFLLTICLMNCGTSILVGQAFVHGAS